MIRLNRASAIGSNQFRGVRTLLRAWVPAPARTSTDSDASVHLVCWSVHEINRLREENATLRQSADTFGALAERLTQALARERNGAPRADG